MTEDLKFVGLRTEALCSAIGFVYETLDAIDESLLNRGSERMAEMVELANLSSMIGNLFRTGVAKTSNALFRSNGPHKHPDLLHRDADDCHVEIKVALEDNQPKGHLAKPGYHLTCHYVLCQTDGTFIRGTDNRGTIAWVWLLRFGKLEESHFNISNTPGDSGKTAVVNAQGMKKLSPIYFTPSLCPLSMSPRATKSKQIFNDFGLPYHSGK